MTPLEVSCYDVLFCPALPGESEVAMVVLAFSAEHMALAPPPQTASVQSELDPIWEQARVELQAGNLLVTVEGAPWMSFALALMQEDPHPISAPLLKQMIEELGGVWLAAMKEGVIVSAGYFALEPDLPPVVQ